MKLFEVLPSLDVGKTDAVLASGLQHIEEKLATALRLIEGRPSINWKRAVRWMKRAREEIVGIDLSLEELAMILERVGFQSGLEHSEGMVFWPILEAGIELLGALDFSWENDVEFKCNESYAVRWWVRALMIGYLVWMLRNERSGTYVPDEMRYMDFARKRSALAERLTAALREHVDAVSFRPQCIAESQNVPVSR